jgi:cell division protein FtsI/penicillin-binding protein 2
MTIEPNELSPKAPPEVQPDPKQAKTLKIEFWRFVLIATVFTLLALLVLFRLASYQLVGETNSVWLDYLPDVNVPRGTIVDRDGELLAIDRFLVDISATPSQLNAKGRAEVAERLAAIAGLDPIDVQTNLVAAADGQYALLAKGLDLEIGRQIVELQEALEDDGEVGPIHSVHVHFVPHRYYPQGDLACHVLGIVGVDNLDESRRKGYYGTEGYYNSFLWRDGAELPGQTFEPIANLAQETERFLPSVAGSDIVLTIDRTLQWIVEDELENALEKYQAQSGTIIVMEPETGAILALANAPDFDPNNYADAETGYLTNPAVSAQWEPGSIYKIITMGAALDAGLIEPTTIFTDTGLISLGERGFFNSDRRAYGRVSASEALARSLNVVTVQIAAELGEEEFYRYIRRFGFGDPTEVDLSGEVTGAVKWPNTLDWSLSDLGANSFGQGLAVTPIQMVSAAGSIANGGKLMRPYIVQARTQGDQMLYTEPTVMHRAISESAARDLTEMMVNVVDTGAPAARVKGYRIAGKTGTAQIPTKDGYTEDETIVSFVGFAPADDPQFVMLIKLDRPDPNISPWASYTAAPAFAQTAARLLEHMNVPSDEFRLASASTETE